MYNYTATITKWTESIYTGRVESIALTVQEESPEKVKSEIQKGIRVKLLYEGLPKDQVFVVRYFND